MTDEAKVRAAMWASALQGAVSFIVPRHDERDRVTKELAVDMAIASAEMMYKEWQSVVGAECGVEEEVVDDDGNSCDNCKHESLHESEEPCMECVKDPINYINWEPKA